MLTMHERLSRLVVKECCSCRSVRCHTGHYWMADESPCIKCGQEFPWRQKAWGESDCLLVFDEKLYEDAQPLGRQNRAEVAIQG